MGDGHIGKKNVVSSYRQMNKEGLNNFLKKLENKQQKVMHSLL